jgi:nucleoside-diphosphate-sugar epimerase
LLAAEAGKECLGQVFNIGSGKNYSVNKVAREILKLSRKDSGFIYVPPVIEPKDTLAGVEKAEKLLKWQPKISLEDGLKETCRFFTGN